MAANDILPWLALLNVLIIPGIVLVVGLRDDVKSATAGLKAHAELDEQRFGEHRRELNRLDRDVGAAHTRLDELAVPAAAGRKRS